MSTDPSIEKEWYKMLTEGEPINRHVYHLFGLLPSNPRCKLCAAPFKSWGGALMRLLGRKPIQIQSSLLCAVRTIRTSRAARRSN